MVESSNVRVEEPPTKMPLVDGQCAVSGQVLDRLRPPL